MTDLRSQEEASLEDAEIQQTQLYAALKAAEQRYIPTRQQEDGLVTQPSGRSMSLQSRYSMGPSQLARTKSAVRGLTDGRGLGSLAPFVLPGILRRASLGSGLDSQMSKLQVFSSQSLPDNPNSSDSERGRLRASTAPRQRPQGIHCIKIELHVLQQCTGTDIYVVHNLHS